MPASTAWWFSAICLSTTGLPVGLIFFTLGIATRARHEPYSGGIQTVGTVTDLTRDNGDGDASYRPGVTFRAENGDLIVFNDTCSSINAPSIGTQVRVSYRPDEPSDARNLDSSCKRSAFVAIVVGVILILCAAVFVSRLAFSCIRWEQCTQRFRGANTNSSTGEFSGSHSEALGLTPSSPKPTRSEATKVQQRLCRVGSMRWRSTEAADNEAANAPDSSTGEELQKVTATSSEPSSPHKHDKECSICYDGVPDHVLLPCGHGGFCAKCSKALFTREASQASNRAGNSCPVCRAPVRTIAKVQLDTAVGNCSSAECVITVRPQATAHSCA